MTSTPEDIDTQLSWRAKWVEVFRDPRVLVIVLLALFAGGLIRSMISTATGGMIELKSDEQKTLDCVERALQSEDFPDDSGRVVALKVCIPD